MESKNGFSLVELVVVLAVGAVLAIVLAGNSFAGFFSEIAGSRDRSALVSAMSNGKCIYQAAFADQMDWLVSGSDASAWPEEGDFASSTDYFIHLVTNDIMNVTYDFFAARGVPPAKTSDPAGFKAENNAWKLVLGLNGARDGTPFIFTRNYAISTVPVSDGPIAPDQLMDYGGTPFGREGLVVVRKGGAAFVLSGDAFRQEAFNPAGAPPDGRTLSVLAP